MRTESRCEEMYRKVFRYIISVLLITTDNEEEEEDLSPKPQACPPPNHQACSPPQPLNPTSHPTTPTTRTKHIKAGGWRCVMRGWVQRASAAWVIHKEDAGIQRGSGRYFHVFFN